MLFVSSNDIAYSSFLFYNFFSLNLISTFQIIAHRVINVHTKFLLNRMEGESAVDVLLKLIKLPLLLELSNDVAI